MSLAKRTLPHGEPLPVEEEMPLGIEPDAEGEAVLESSSKPLSEPVSGPAPRIARGAALPPQTDPEPEEAAPPSRSLIRVGDDSALTFAERVAAKLHRLAWRTPLHSLRLKGRYPLKLLAVPRDPMVGDAEAGARILAGDIVRGRETMPVDRIEWGRGDLSPAFADSLQSFGWLRDLAAAAGRKEGAPVAERAVASWLDRFGTRMDESAWRADLWGRRILFWTAYAPYILSSRDLVYRSTVLNTLARGARHLDSVADKAPIGLPRVAAWIGVIASGILIQGGPSRVKRGEAGLLRALGVAQHDDGGLASRSPSEQLELVELLAMLRQAYAAARTLMPEPLADALAGATSALVGITLGDGGLSSWQGGNPGSPARIAAAVEGTGLTPRPLRFARGWGYQRLAALGTAVIIDAAPPPVSRVLTGGCASTLGIEFSDGAHRLVVNCGGPGREATALPPAMAAALRSTAAHSTLILADTNSTAIHEDGSLGRGVSEVELARDELDLFSRVEATHGGYVRRYGLSHKRQLALSADGRELRGEDTLVPQGRKRIRDAIPFAIRFHLGIGVEPIITADGLGALLRVRGGNDWQFRCRGAGLAIEESLWIDGEGTPHAGAQLVVTGETPAGGAQISWLFKRASA